MRRYHADPDMSVQVALDTQCTAPARPSVSCLLLLPAHLTSTVLPFPRANATFPTSPRVRTQMGFSMMDAVRCSKATGSNLKTLYETQELFLSFGENIKRVADELADSTYAVHEMMDIELPDGLEQVCVCVCLWVVSTCR